MKKERPSMGKDEPVTVCRKPGDHLVITVPLSELQDPHLRSISGGARRVSGQSSLYARMWCTAIPEGEEFGHSCKHGPPPHEILVCITESNNDRTLYRDLRRQIDPEYGKKRRHSPEEAEANRERKEQRRTEAKAYIDALNLSEVAQELQVTVPTVRAYIKKGRLKALKLDSSYRYFLQKYRPDGDNRPFRGYRVSRTELNIFKN